MAVVKSGEESIVRHCRWLIGVYYVLVVAAGILSLLSLVVASWFGGALALGTMAGQLYTMARALGRSYVAIGPEGLRLSLPRSDGKLWRAGKERHFKWGEIGWGEIGDISYEGNLRRQECKFQAGTYVYSLNANNCPSPKMVARMLAEKKGVVLK